MPTKSPTKVGTLYTRYSRVAFMYDYRNMSSDQRRKAVEYRRLRERPWHSPPHWEFAGLLQFMISSACYEHEHIIGVTPERMTECESACWRRASGLWQEFTLGAFCLITITYWYRRIVSRNSELNWENFMAVRRSNGTEKTIGEDVKFGTIPWTGASSHMVISGLALTTFTTIQYITAM